MLKVEHAIRDKGIVKGKILEWQLFFSKYCEIIIIIIIAQMEAIHCTET